MVEYLVMVGVVVILLTAGCDSTGKLKLPPISIEACYVDPEYGKICGVITRDTNGEISVMARVDVELPSAVRDRFNAWAQDQILKVKR